MYKGPGWDYCCYGEFKCEKCGRKWSSNKSWAVFGQKCAKCLSSVDPEPSSFAPLYYYECRDCHKLWKHRHEKDGRPCPKCTKPANGVGFKDYLEFIKPRIGLPSIYEDFIEDPDEDANQESRGHRKDLCEICRYLKKPCSSWNMRGIDSEEDDSEHGIRSFKEEDSLRHLTKSRPLDTMFKIGKPDDEHVWDSLPKILKLEENLEWPTLSESDGDARPSKTQSTSKNSSAGLDFDGPCRMFSVKEPRKLKPRLWDIPSPQIKSGFPKSRETTILTKTQDTHPIQTAIPSSSGLTPKIPVTFTRPKTVAVESLQWPSLTESASLFWAGGRGRGDSTIKQEFNGLESSWPYYVKTINFLMTTILFVARSQGLMGDGEEGLGVPDFVLWGLTLALFPPFQSFCKEVYGYFGTKERINLFMVFTKEN